MVASNKSFNKNPVKNAPTHVGLWNPKNAFEESVAPELPISLNCIYLKLASYLLILTFG